MPCVEIIYSLRFFSIESVSIANVGGSIMFGNMNYFPQDPAVTFGAFFALSEGFRYFYKGKPYLSFMYVFSSIICLASLVGMMVRAPMILWFIVFLALVFFERSNIIARFLVLIFSFVLVYCLWDRLADLIVLVAQKFSNVGMNNKDKEFLVVFKDVVSDPFVLLFGWGWGGLIQTPTFGGPVRFVHNFWVYFFAKAGVVGGIFASMIIVYGYLLLFTKVARSFLMGGVGAALGNWGSPAIGLLAVLSSSLFLQANFKSLTFGFILFLTFLVHLRNYLATQKF
jgi:hypothetical protein